MYLFNLLYKQVRSQLDLHENRTIKSNILNLYKTVIEEKKDEKNWSILHKNIIKPASIKEKKEINTILPFSIENNILDDNYINDEEKQQIGCINRKAKKNLFGKRKIYSK